jgi:hypothetical protein
MLRAWILLWLFAASGLSVSSAQNTPPIAIAKISLPDPAYVGMPIWMQVESPSNHTVHYPSSTTPNDFYCNEVNVKQNGRLLSPLKGFPPGGRAGAACGWLGVADIAQSKLPIHLQYPLTQPGTYLVRFTRREYRRTGKLEIAEQSDWGFALTHSATWHDRVLAESSTFDAPSRRRSTAGRRAPVAVGEPRQSCIAADD